MKSNQSTDLLAAEHIRAAASAEEGALVLRSHITAEVKAIVLDTPDAFRRTQLIEYFNVLDALKISPFSGQQPRINIEALQISEDRAAKALAALEASLKR
jgi:hypothetical protein